MRRPLVTVAAAAMDLTARLALGDLCLQTLLQDDAGLLVEATRHEQAPALWGPRPAGAYSIDEARRGLQHWDPAGGKRASYGVLRPTGWSRRPGTYT